MKFGFIDLVTVVIGLCGYRLGRKRGLFLSLYKLIALIVAVFMFYRFQAILKFLANRFQNQNLVYALGLVFMVFAVLLIFRILLGFVYKFVEAKPAIGIFEILAGLFGLCYGLLWMGVILKAVFFYMKFETLTGLISNTFSARFILPLPLWIYDLIIGIGSKLFTP